MVKQREIVNIASTAVGAFAGSRLFGWIGNSVNQEKGREIGLAAGTVVGAAFGNLIQNPASDQDEMERQVKDILRQKLMKVGVSEGKAIEALTYFQLGEVKYQYSFLRNVVNFCAGAVGATIGAVSGLFVGAAGGYVATRGVRNVDKQVWKDETKQDGYMEKGVLGVLHGGAVVSGAFLGLFVGGATGALVGNKLMDGPSKRQLETVADAYLPILLSSIQESQKAQLETANQSVQR